ENGFEPDVQGLRGGRDHGAAGYVSQPGAIDFDNAEAGAPQAGVDAENADYRHVGSRGGRIVRPILVTEMASAGVDHGQAAFVGGRDDFVVAYAAARLDDAGGAGVGHDVQAVAKWKERVGGDRRTGKRQAGVLGLDRGDARRVDAAHLAGANAQRHV